MPKPVADRIRKFLDLYERGILTRGEVCHRIAELAIDPSFFDQFEMLPDFVLNELLNIARYAPAHPDDCGTVGAICSRSGYDRKAHDEGQREIGVLLYWSSRRLREHFYPDLPFPEFEPIKFFGVVEETVEAHATIAAIFDKKQGCFIRTYHTIHLDPPEKPRITTSTSGTGLIKTDSDRESSDPFRQRFGRSAIFLGENVTSIDDVPPGTKVWVDRTAVAEIPPPPSLD